MNRHNHWWAGFQRAAAALLVLLSAPALVLAQSDPPGRVGRLADLQGSVWFYDDEEGAWHAAERNLPVTNGDRYATDGNGRAEIRVGSTVLRLGASTELELLQLDDDRLRVQLHRGALALQVISAEIAAGVEVITAEGRMQPLRAGHYRFDRIDDVSFAGVWRGELQYQGQDNLRLVGAGERIEVWLDGRRDTARTRDAAMPSDRLAAWAVEADRQAQRSAAHRYVSPEMTGVEELDRHGRWDQHPEYGAVWVPMSVAPDWAPYRDGRWVWQRPWGWTWVDAAPWGFAPFHYGRWVSWRGRWGWWPGVYEARPVFAPALVAWVGGPHVGVSVTIGGGPNVGWVPLAPREVYVPSYAVTPVYVSRINRGHYHPGHKDRPGRPGRPRGRDHVDTGPIMYSNQGVPGAVTVVPSNVLRSRQPVAPAVVPNASVIHRTVVEAPPPPRQRPPRREERPAPVMHDNGPDATTGPVQRVRPAPPMHDNGPDATQVVPPRVQAPQRGDRGERPERAEREPRAQREQREQPERREQRGEREPRPAPVAEPQRKRPPESRQDMRRRDQVQ